MFTVKYFYLHVNFVSNIPYGLPSSSVQILSLMSETLLLGVNFIFTVKYFYLHVHFVSNILLFAKLLHSNFKFNIKNTSVSSKL